MDRRPLCLVASSASGHSPSPLAWMCIACGAVIKPLTLTVTHAVSPSKRTEADPRASTRLVGTGSSEVEKTEGSPPVCAAATAWDPDAAAKARSTGAALAAAIKNVLRISYPLKVWELSRSHVLRQCLRSTNSLPGPRWTTHRSTRYGGNTAKSAEVGRSADQPRITLSCSHIGPLLDRTRMTSGES